MNKRAQAALEFLMTYGWAILVVIIAISSLAYFGVLSPDKFLPEKCVLPPGLACLSYRIGEDTAKLVIQNSLGQSIAVSRVDVDAGGSGCVYSSSVTLNNGQKYSFNMTGCSNGNYGKKFRSDVYVTYTDEEGMSQEKVGEIISKVQE